MTVNRYEFEILKYIEKHGPGHYTTRFLQDHLYISNATCGKCLDSLRERGLLSCGEKGWSVCPEGLKALEPYRVKKAIIFAAGFGSRMVPVTLTTPKPMVKVHGVRLIDTLLDALLDAGISEITIVRGYKKEAFDELKDKYPMVRFIDNDRYETENNISSAVLASDGISGRLYICEADLYITNPDVIEKYQYTTNFLGSYSLETDDWSYRLEDGHTADYKKGNTYCYNYYGISFWTEEDAEKLRKDFTEVYAAEGGKEYFWEFVPLVLKKDNYRIEIRPCMKQDIMEIDNYEELTVIDPSYPKL